MSAASILATGKDGYACDREFDERTVKALGGDERLLFKDALDIEQFVTGDYQTIAPVLARLRGYRILELGCGYGRLASLLAAFDCAEYLGVDRARERVEYARRRHAGGPWRFEVADALAFRSERRFDVVWTCHMLQHLLLKEKLRLVETAKRALAPEGAVLMCEEEIVDCSVADAERQYASPDHARHMVPVTFDELARAFRPLGLRHLGGIVYVASE